MYEENTWIDDMPNIRRTQIITFFISFAEFFFSFNKLIFLIYVLVSFKSVFFLRYDKGSLCFAKSKWFWPQNLRIPPCLGCFVFVVVCGGNEKDFHYCFFFLISSIITVFILFCFSCIFMFMDTLIRTATATASTKKWEKITISGYDAQFFHILISLES